MHIKCDPNSRVTDKRSKMQNSQKGYIMVLCHCGTNFLTLERRCNNIILQPVDFWSLNQRKSKPDHLRAGVLSCLIWLQSGQVLVNICVLQGQASKWIVPFCVISCQSRAAPNRLRFCHWFCLSNDVNKHAEADATSIKTCTERDYPLGRLTL